MADAGKEEPDHDESAHDHRGCDDRGAGEQGRRVIRRVFPDRTVLDVAAAGTSWNRTNHTVRVRFSDHDPVYCKHSTEPDGTRTARECGVLRYLADGSTVLVPELVACDPDASPAFLVTQSLNGRSFDAVVTHDDGDHQRLARELGRILARLHDHRFDRHGWITVRSHTPDAIPLDADGTHESNENGAASDDGTRSHQIDGRTPALDPTPWPALLCETIREHDRISPTDQYEWAIERLLTAVGSRATSLARVPEVLCHGDVTGADCLVTDRGVGLLDWEMAHVGDPVRSLYRARRALCDPLEHPPEATLDALHDGYCAHAGSLPDGFDDRKPIYHAQRLVVLAGFADRLADWFPDRDLHAWLAGELDRRLSRIE